MNKNSGRHIKALLSLPPVYSFLLLKVYRQKKCVKSKLLPLLQEYRLHNDGSLKPEDFKKITDYYALGVPGILGESFSILRGSPLLHRERECLTFLGSISGLLDDLFDDPHKSPFHLEEFILRPERMKPTTTHEALLLQFYKLGLENSPHPHLLKQTAIKVFTAQKESTAQTAKEITPQQIEEITYAKGGNSFIFYRLGMEQRLEAAEQEFLYNLGGLMQLGNDIFDVWEDDRDGVRTVASICTNIPALRSDFQLKLEHTFALAKRTGYAPKNVERFRRISLMALARVFVCLDQFEKLQKKSGDHFSIKEYTRKELICDMQKPGNQLKSMYYFSKLI